ncbi:MAG: MarR family transcriptional regulator [Clostridia bacterium]|nr:MarR family transcriptional regulator [Clostridia bacterium]
MENEQRIKELNSLSCKVKNCFDIQPIGNLTLNELSSLITIYTQQEQKGSPLTMSEAGEILGLGRSAASQLIARLERKGMVRRETVLCDRRKTTIKFTAKTKKYIEKFETDSVNNMKKVIDIIGEDKIDEFIELYTKYVEAIEEVNNA